MCEQSNVVRFMNHCPATTTRLFINSRGSILNETICIMTRNFWFSLSRSFHAHISQNSNRLCCNVATRIRFSMSIKFVLAQLSVTAQFLYRGKLLMLYNLVLVRFYKTFFVN